tara:strand:+ start:1437 stop:2081 length:645 start_codon:yes stop_codon:yes gene_type:complete
MTDNEYEHFEALWLYANEPFGKTPSDSATKIVFRALQKYSFGDIQRGIEKHMIDPDNGMFAPKPADVVRNVDGPKADRGIKALMKAEEAARQYGRNVTGICFDDPIIHRTIQDFGGWAKFYDHFICSNPKRHFDEKEFLNRYDRYAKHGCESYPKLLRGDLTHTQKLDVENGKEKTILIGDKEKAKLTYENSEKSNVVFLKIMGKGKGEFYATN